MIDGQHSGAQPCVYCNGLARIASPEQREIAVWDRPIAQTDDWLVVPSKGSLIPGWLLVVPREHSLCSGALSAPERSSLFHVASVVSGAVQEAFGMPATVFEHGPATHGDVAGCGINHTHLHVVPLGFSLVLCASRVADLGSWRDATRDDLQSSHSRSTSYLAVLESNRQLLMSEPLRPTSQALRRVIAAEIGFPERWDYRIYDGASEVAETMQRLRGFRVQLQEALESTAVAA